MKISNLIETMATPTSMPAPGQPGAKFGRSDEMIESDAGTTGSGSIASTAQPVGKIQRRGQGSMFQGIKTSAKYANSRKAGIKEDAVNEDELSEEQLQAKHKREETFKRAKDRELGNKPKSRDIQVNELSTDKLAQYKTAAGKQATAADKAGDYKKGNKRFSGIVQATKKQYANDTKSVSEAAGPTMWEVHYDYGPHQSNEVKVKASSEEEARAKVVRQAKTHGQNSIMINWARPAEKSVKEGEIERQHGDIKPWAYWSFPERVAKKLYQMHKGQPIDKSAIVQLWKTDGPDRMTKFMLKPDVSEILAYYQQMSEQGPLFKEGVAEDVASSATNPEDKICVDVPLFIRLMEYAREDAKSDMDLHSMTERLTALSASGKTLGMDSYDAVVDSDTPVDETSIGDMRSHFDSIAEPEVQSVPHDVSNEMPEEIVAILHKVNAKEPVSKTEYMQLLDYKRSLDEAAKNPYAIGMASAMKSTGDKPPLKKSTITKAHTIARSIKEK